MNKEDYSKYYIQGSDHYLIPKDEFVCLLKEIKELQSQLSYLRSGEYYNQLRFENEMLQNVVDTNGIPSEVYDYIECTHRNTELLEENQQLKNELEQSNAVADTNKELAESFHKEIERLKSLLKCDYEDGQSIMAELTTENKQLKETNLAMQEEMARTWAKLEQKEDIINKTKDVIKQMMTIGYAKGTTFYYASDRGSFDVRAKVLLEILDNKGEMKDE